MAEVLNLVLRDAPAQGPEHESARDEGCLGQLLDQVKQRPRTIVRIRQPEDRKVPQQKR